MHDVPEQLREWSQSLADTIEPVDVERARSTMTVEAVQVVHADGSHTRRWLAVAASVVVVAAGFFAVAQLSESGSDRISPVIDPPPTVITATTSPADPQNSATDTTPVEELAVVQFPGEQEADWIVPWDDGFLVGAVNFPAEVGDESTVRALFTTDGSSWEPLEMSMPPGMTNPARILSVGDRFIMAGSPEPVLATDVIRVASTNDLLNWSFQDFEVPGPRQRDEQSAFGGSFTSMGSFAANEAGWTFEVQRIYTADVAVVLPADLQERVDQGADYRMRSDDAGFSVAFDGSSGSPPIPESIYEFTWEDVGITPDGVPYMTGEIPTSRTWAATWDGSPAVAEQSIQRGPTLASPEGFVRWNDTTWFSIDGLTWSASPLPDPNGTVENAFAIDSGFVAIVRNADGTIDVYGLDERGGNPRLIEVDGLPQRFATGFSGEVLPDYAEPGATVAVFDAARTGSSLDPPVVIDLNGYRLLTSRGVVSVIDLATGETILTEDVRRGAPATDTVVEFSATNMIVTDPASETVLMDIPIETYHEARQEAQSTQPTTSTPDEANGEPSTDLRMLATTDGEQFLVEALRSSDPNFDTQTSTISVSTNGKVALVRLGDEWIRYELAP